METPVRKLVSVIIVAYVNYQIVLDCIASIHKYNDLGEGLEIILVDNSPDHRVAAHVRNQFPSVICVDNINNGFGYGNNIGVNNSAGKYLFFLNPDTLLMSNIFAESTSFFEQHSNVGMLGFKMVDEMGGANRSFYLLEGGGLVRNAVERISNKLDLFVNSFMYIAGSAMLIPREIFEKIGRFDENIFMYYEEPDITRRIHDLGYIVKYKSHVKIIHLEGGATSDAGLAFQRRIKSLRYYCDKYQLNFSSWVKREIRVLYIKYFFGILCGGRGDIEIKKKINFLAGQ